MGCDESPGPVGCAFGPSHLIATAQGPSFHELALVDSDGPRVFWSDRRGLYAQRLGPRGGPIEGAEAVRLSAPCPGGLAVVGGTDGVEFACARPADRDRGRAGSVTVFAVEGDILRTRGRVGPLGPESRGVSVARDGNRTVVGWRDADGLTAVARRATVGPDGASEAEPLSTLGTLASAPALDIIEGEIFAAWTESWLGQDGRPTGHLFVAAPGRPPRPSLDVGDIDVRVRLSHDARGPIVTLRDSRPRGARHRTFVGRVDENLAVGLSELHSPGRADAENAHPSVVACGGYLFAIATRRSSREVTMVTVERLDPESLRSAGPEHQIYEYHVRFPQAVGLCVQGRLLLAVGERATEVGPVPRLRTYELHCGPGVQHQRTPRIDGLEHDLVD